MGYFPCNATLTTKTHFEMKTKATRICKVLLARPSVACDINGRSSLFHESYFATLLYIESPTVIGSFGVIGLACLSCRSVLASMLDGAASIAQRGLHPASARQQSRSSCLGQFVSFLSLAGGGGLRGRHRMDGLVDEWTKRTRLSRIEGPLKCTVRDDSDAADNFMSQTDLLHWCGVTIYRWLDDIVVLWCLKWRGHPVRSVGKSGKEARVG